MKPESAVMSTEPNKGGRPVSVPNSKRVFVLLDPAQVARASQLGNGNLSAGIRAALSPHLVPALASPASPGALPDGSGALNSPQI